MSFSLHQNYYHPIFLKTHQSILPDVKQKINESDQQESLIKSHKQIDKLNWIKKKYSQLDKINRFSPINLSTSNNFKNETRQNFALKSQIISHSKQILQNFNKKQKRLLSESVFYQQKRRKSQYSKFFNQTLVDNDHNFIGKSYLRQVQNCKLKPKQYKSQSSSPKKIFISTNSQLFYKESKLNSLLNYHKKFVKPIFGNQQNYSQSINIRKKWSLNEQGIKSKLSQKDLTKHSINQKLIKQIEDNVKKDIKAQMKKLKKLKLNKYRMKYNQEKSKKKNLQISNIKKCLPYLLSESTPTSLQQSTIVMVKNKDKSVNIRNRLKQNQNIKKPLTSFYSYQDKGFKSYNNISIHPISEELNPWQIQNTQFHGLG